MLRSTRYPFWLVRHLHYLGGLVLWLTLGVRIDATETFRPEIPRTWDPVALRDVELPVAGLNRPPGHVPPEYYYAQPVRPIYVSYPVYPPDREPPGYLEELAQREPVVVWDDRGVSPTLATEADWVRAGEIVFDAPIDFIEMTPAERAQRREQLSTLPYRLNAAGEVPFYRYVVRQKGKVELGFLSCAECHTRVMPDGSVIKGAQGNPPFDLQFAAEIRAGSPAGARFLQRLLFAAPWAGQPYFEKLGTLTPAEIAAWHETVPPGVLARHGTGGFTPVQIPDLIGASERRYLDHTGLQRNRGIGDLMRYAALNQGADLLSDFGGFIPAANKAGQRPDPQKGSRYSDEQLYALALYLRQLKPPPNPHPFDALAQRGQEIFEAENCSRCHDPEQGYTNNRLVAAPGFEPPEDHPARSDIMQTRVDTDPTLALVTRRGTGLYKVPSLRGVWYRSHFEHNGSCATLEDWFDPRRLEEDYVPTGWKGPPGTRTRAVRGHDYGLDLSADDRRALLAFLRTL